MFKKLFVASFFLFAFQISSPSCVSAHEAVDHVQWNTNYDASLKQAQSSSKPLVLLFTGSDWCGWCKKLESNVLDTHDFANVAGDKFVFVKLDFPQFHPQDPKEAEQNKALQTKYGIHGFPTLIILNSKGDKLGETGYLAKTPQEYANHLLEFVHQNQPK